MGAFSLTQPVEMWVHRLWIELYYNSEMAYTGLNVLGIENKKKCQCG